MKVETLVKVDFYGDPVLAYQDEDGKVWVAAKQLARNLGLNWSAQYRKLKSHEVLSKGVAIKQYLTAGGEQRTVFIDLDYLPYWLASISPKKAAPGVREKLVRYQTEVVKVLRDYFFKGAVINPRVPGDMLERVIARAVEQYAQGDIRLLVFEEIKRRKAETLISMAERVAQIPGVSKKYVHRLIDVAATTMLEKELPKVQISVSEFLAGKGIYKRRDAIRFGQFLARYYKEKTGRGPRKSTTIINGKEVLTNYYTNEDLPLMEEAFAVWVLNGQKNAQPAQQQGGRAITSRTLFKHNGRRIGG